MRKVAVYVKDEFAGELIEEDRQRYLFRYDLVYFTNPDKPPVSLTLPKTQLEYHSTHLFPYFFNMLSEGDNRALQSRAFQIDENDHFGIMMETATHDVIGAVKVKAMK
jgi:HipA-like protein